jgi:LacI family transcriptional regulator
MARKIVRIGVSIEYQRGTGRKVCQGIAAVSHDHPEWHLSMFKDSFPSADEITKLDGFLWDISDARIAQKLIATGKPVIDLVNDGKYPGTISVGADHMACGQLAARHFITRHFSHFAFCGWKGLRFSDARQQAYVRALQLNHFACYVYSPEGLNMSKFIRHYVMQERFVLPEDAEALAKWLKGLPKPVGVFCANDLRAWQVAEVCRVNKISVPGTVAILGADNDLVPCLFVYPPISSVDTDAVEIGRRAAEVLVGILSEQLPKSHPPTLVKPIGIVMRKSTEVFPLDPVWLAEALVFIRANVSKSLTASDVSAHVGLSYPTVENAFRTMLGTTVQKEIMSVRLETAEHLLSTTRLTVAEVAARSGFRSPQYFCLCFSRRHGISPGAFRKN